MRNKAVESIVINAIIIAIIALMILVPPYIGMIPLGFVSITIVPAVVLIFAWIFGWKEAMVAGVTFGLLSMVRAYVMPQTPAD